MRVWVFSDLHLQTQDMEDRGKIFPTIPEADVCVCAGDLVDGDIVRGVEWLSKHIRPSMRVVMINGNHEFYRRSIDETVEAGRRCGILNGVDFLDDASVTIGGTRIFGTTLWTDFNVFARGDGVERGRAMAFASDYISDYRLIRPFEAKQDRWTPVMSWAQHMSSLALLEVELTKSAQPVVVVSHHAPHPQSIAPAFAQSLLTPGFVSDLTPVITQFRPVVWIHGHTHSTFDYMVADTRVICNPLGYAFEQTGFDPQKVIEV